MLLCPENSPAHLDIQLRRQSNPDMSSLKMRGYLYIGVRNIDAAVAWYKDKLRLQESDEEIDEEEGNVVLVSADLEGSVTVGAPNKANVDTPIFFVGNAEKARAWLADRGVSVSAIQTDRQGTHYFEMRDLENNMIEFSEEP